VAPLSAGAGCVSSAAQLSTSWCMTTGESLKVGSRGILRRLPVGWGGGHMEANPHAATSPGGHVHQRGVCWLL
jgi:hypothetical protein